MSGPLLCQTITALITCCILQAFSCTNFYISLLSNCNAAFYLPSKFELPFSSTQSHFTHRSNTATLPPLLPLQSPTFASHDIALWSVTVKWNYIYFLFNQKPLKSETLILWHFSLVKITKLQPLYSQRRHINALLCIWISTTPDTYLNLQSPHPPWHHSLQKLHILLCAGFKSSESCAIHHLQTAEAIELFPSHAYNNMAAVLSLH